MMNKPPNRLVFTFNIILILLISVLSAGLFVNSGSLKINPHFIPVAVIRYIGVLCFMSGFIQIFIRDPMLMLREALLWRAWKSLTKLERTLILGGWLLFCLSIVLQGIISTLFGYWYLSSGVPVFLPGTFF